MALKQPNRIPAEDLEAFQSWHLPDMEADGGIVPSAEKEAKDRGGKHRRARTEIVEDVDSDDITLGPMTAQQLQEITEAAEQEGYKKGKAQGYQQGQTEGFKKGQTKGSEAMRKLLQEQQQRLKTIADELLQPLTAQRQGLENALLDITCTLTQAIVKRELLSDSSHILTLVQEAVSALPAGTKNLKVHVNPDDLALVEAFAEERQKDWQFLGDSDLLPGGCRIETAESLVDFSVEQRMAVLLEQFVNKQLSNGEPGDTDASPTP